QTSDYIPIDGNTLPTLGTESKFSIVGSGTYTQSVGADVVVPENSLGVLVWDGSEWSLSQSAEMPVGSLKEWVAGSYLQGDVRTYKNKVYRAKVGTTATPTGFDWQEIGGRADAVIDQNATINFN